MPLALKNNNERWTYADYLTWPDDERWEIIDGVAYAMSPSPGKRHQELFGELFRQIANFLKGKSCKVFAAPFDVRLSDISTASDNYAETVVQPDIFVVCDKNKLDERGCKGAPDLIIEISSPSTGKNDLTIKFGGLTAVSDFSLNLFQHDLVGLIGPNGAGKTTIFNMLTGVYAPTTGTIEFNGEFIQGIKPYEITKKRISAGER